MQVETKENIDELALCFFIIFFEDFIEKPDQIISELLDFLDIPDFEYSRKLVHTNRSFSGDIRHKRFDNPKSFLEKLNKVLYILKLSIFKSGGKKSYSIKPETRQKLLENLLEDTKCLEELTQRDLNHWMI